MKTVGVIGAGTMGSGIAHVSALSGFDVFLYDIEESLLNNALQRISTDLRKSFEKGKITETQSAETGARIHPRLTMGDFSKCAIIIEAAVELLKTKRSIFEQLDTLCSPDVLLATNTSSLSVTSIASATRYPERVLGMHFFNPPHIIKLLEIVKCRRTSDQTIERAIQFAQQLGKQPVVVKDTPGFIVNRCARPFYGEALRLLGEGVTSIEEIDRIVKLEGGFKMGPFELMDLIGIDVNLSVTKSMYEQTFYEPRYKPHHIQQALVDAGHLGRKTKQGFYRYES
ncbi:MAG TPA: 3-hydroxyacyl-CoA dehydrogenase NAD-binding domain-containing protein [Bacteroidota bacterium]|nr:3-hydroxyacyl-CoA dehydrogenase NAD-binding domain-containing protein [Bacteroidota bacterium]